MAEKIGDDTWTERIAAQVGQRVKAARESRVPRMSAQSLADSTVRLGHEVKRSVISNLESGRRGTVTLADVLVLAYALDVPPMLLMTPLGTDDACEVLPGRMESTWDAVEWISGHDPLPGDREERSAEWSLVTVFEQHRDQLDLWRLRHKQVERNPDQAEAALALENARNMLAMTRDSMRRQGITPPSFDDSLLLPEEDEMDQIMREIQLERQQQRVERLKNIDRED
ncbi:helix-turn-helix transcriptional regulator [Plantibacter sp. VKM Ac-2880]|uniref:helix-turn-helix domain-containing protein n=1 Tax=Plantibacter sp. VKM Ac-2880 TaxID=2783827 RepID=UPI00188FD789|nr:helix-turn-helix transcriptional regulator [Plantibacter sp. VKM Ac-2880]MBF4568512.1 helix-turn-helix transcriptional regulator [Plantibacter sp. VKM Ac-2880]